MKNKEIGMEQETKDSRNENVLDVFGMNTNYFGNELYNVALFIDYENVTRTCWKKKEILFVMDSLKKSVSGAKSVTADLLKLLFIVILTMMTCMTLTTSRYCNLMV